MGGKVNVALGIGILISFFKLTETDMRFQGRGGMESVEACPVWPTSPWLNGQHIEHRVKITALIINTKYTEFCLDEMTKRSSFIIQENYHSGNAVLCFKQQQQYHHHQQQTSSSRRGRRRRKQQNELFSDSRKHFLEETESEEGDTLPEKFGFRTTTDRKKSCYK